MQAYRDGLNVDRLVAYCALVAFAKVQQSNRGVARKVERENLNENAKMSQNLTKLKVNPFRHMGGSSSALSEMRKPRNAFKNLK
jgi:hypothetical protein